MIVSFLNNRYLRFCLLLLILIPISLYVWAMFRFATNVPFFDDFEWSFEFLDNYQQASGFLEKIRLLLSPHNEHRMIMTRLTVISLTAFNHDLNLQHMAWLGNLYIFGVFLILWRYLRFSSTSILWLLPLAYFWFQLQYFQNIMTTYSVPNNSVIFFAFATVLAFCSSITSTGNGYFILTLLLAIITTLCNGNGIVMLPIVCVLYFISGNSRRGVVAFFVLTLTAVMHISFLPLDGNKVTFSLKTLAFFIDMLSIAALPSYESVSLVIGTVLLLAGVTITLFWIIRSVTEKPAVTRLFLIGSYGFLVGTAAVTAIMRASYNLAPAPWYKGYSLLFISVSFLIILEFLENRPAKLYLLIVAFTLSIVSFYFSTIYFIPEFNSFKNYAVADGINFSRNDKWAFIPIQANNEKYLHFNEVSKKLVANGDYILPPVPPQLKLPNDKVIFDATIHVKQVYVPFQKATVITYEPTKPLKERVFGFISNAQTKEMIIFGVYQPLNGKKNILKGKTLFLPTYSFSVQREFFADNITAGTYTAGFVTFNVVGKAIWLKSNVEVEIVNI